MGKKTVYHFAYGYPIVPASFVEVIILSLLNNFSTSGKKINCPYMFGSISGLNDLSHLAIFISLY